MVRARKSHWEFVTSNGGSLALGVIMGEGGSVTLAAPKTGNHVKFRYGAFGIGIGIGYKIPKLGRVSLPGTSGSGESFPSNGYICMTPQFRGMELSVGNFAGGCMFQEASGGLAFGVSACVMTSGMNVASLAAGPTNPLAMQHALQSATGNLVFKGANFGIQTGVGLATYVGIMRPA